jgi:4-amino-4-deoxy-L-arabinose transferase-like glycosyltransferase
VLIAALAIRVAYVQNTSFKPVNDASIYNILGSSVARTGGYDLGHTSGSGAGGSRGPTAYFPPAFPYYLAAVDILTGHQAGGRPAIHDYRLAQTVLGTAAVGLLGLVALEAFGPGIALIAMILAAVYPVFIESDGTLVAENLLIVFELAAIWTALRARRSDRPYAWIAATGVLTGLATLTHENAALLLIPLGFAAAFAVSRARNPSRARNLSRARNPGRSRTAGAVALLVLTTAITIAPWTIRNAVELHHFVPVSDETGITLVGTYNPDSAAFKPVPYKWRFFWKISEDQHLRRTAGRYTEVELGSKLESQALHYIGAHPLSPLKVAYHNTLRLFELAGSYAWHASALAVGMHISNARTGVVSFWVMCVLALIGLFTRAARRAPRWLWAIPVLFALSVVFVNVETPRFREPIDPFFVLLAGCAVATAIERLRALRLGRAPVRRGGRAPRMARNGELVEMVQRLP